MGENTRNKIIVDTMDQIRVMFSYINKKAVMRQKLASWSEEGPSDWKKITEPIWDWSRWNFREVD